MSGSRDCFSDKLEAQASDPSALILSVTSQDREDRRSGGRGSCRAANSRTTRLSKRFALPRHGPPALIPPDSKCHRRQESVGRKRFIHHRPRRGSADSILAARDASLQRAKSGRTRPPCLPEQRKPVVWVDTLFVQRPFRSRSPRPHFLVLLVPRLEIGAPCTLVANQATGGWQRLTTGCTRGQLDLDACQSVFWYIDFTRACRLSLHGGHH
jgi:hypothetical protein